MALIDLISKAKGGLSLGGKKPLEYDGQVSKLKQMFAKSSELDLDGKKPTAYTDDLPR